MVCPHIKGGAASASSYLRLEETTLPQRPTAPRLLDGSHRRPTRLQYGRSPTIGYRLNPRPDPKCGHGTVIHTLATGHAYAYP